MNVVLFPNGEGRARHFDLARPLTIAVIAAFTLGIVGMAFAVGMQLGQRSSRTLGAGESDRWARILGEQKTQIADMKSQLQERVDAMAMRLGQVDAHVIRLDALGKRLTTMAKIDNREFNFDTEPSTGGPEAAEGEGVSARIPDLNQMLDQLEKRVELRDAQLNALESVILARKLSEDIKPEGRPIRKGFISSHFGDRQDPFTGHQAFHKGVDFAGASGSEIVAVAAGVVTYAGDRTGYGATVEVSHGSGFVTRYGHNQKNLVTVGQTVTRGQAIALMGSTGRSTGPHVHFEVMRNGRQVNPLTFVGR
jgi:murein DD-endopeptidase MepM/ murein hydrolase activator NlpD